LNKRRIKVKKLKEIAIEARKFIYLASDRCDTIQANYNLSTKQINELEKIRTKLAKAFKQLAQFLE